MDLNHHLWLHRACIGRNVKQSWALHTDTLRGGKNLPSGGFAATRNMALCADMSFSLESYSTGCGCFLPTSRECALNRCDFCRFTSVGSQAAGTQTLVSLTQGLMLYTMTLRCLASPITRHCQFIFHKCLQFPCRGLLP